MEEREKRRYQRLMKPFLVSCVNRRGGAQTIPVTMAITHDISLDGAGIEISLPLEPGSAMEMEICMDDCLFPVAGKVVHIHQYGMETWRAGVQFSTPPYTLLDVLASTLHAPLS